MEAADVRRAVRAATVTAARLGLHADDAVVISNSDRIVVRLVPCYVLARVAPAAHGADAEFEVEVARHLAERGAPVAELESRIGQQVHRRDGFVVSFWTYYEPVGPAITPGDYAAALVRHHAALRTMVLAAPHVSERIGGAVRLIDDSGQTPELPESDREFLRNQLDALVAATTGGTTGDQLLHGEPHPGNVLATAKGPLFVDLATCCRGPVEFDLAHAPDDVARHYPGADPALLRLCRAAGWALFATWRWRRDDQFPDRQHWRVEGIDRVRAALGSH